MQPSKPHAFTHESKPTGNVFESFKNLRKTVHYDRLRDTDASSSLSISLARSSSASKEETAINIGWSTRMLKKGMRKVLLTSSSCPDAAVRLKGAVGGGLRALTC